MFFFPIGCLLLILFILLLPVLFIIIFLNIATFSFEKLGISSGIALLVLLATLVGSMVNIPLTRRTVQSYGVMRVGWFQVPVQQESGLAINLGGAVIPIILSGYLFSRVPIVPVLAATLIMTIICKFLTRPIPAEVWRCPFFIPPVISALLAILLARDFAAPCAYISGVLGTLIGGDLLNLWKARRLGSGIVSIGGAGVFDGIFLVGIAAVALTALV